ncbi:uncharacterized protein LOC128869998 [Anastrepha ludens]|uniref:uncharacterized protein LOC128869998 n=1 Tax=Anastrepha ludens TaxID=28586 RepID=UPI0023AED141|nr:uncharacterized protein LOC128869998 [Anastrepha ludens]
MPKVRKCVVRGCSEKNKQMFLLPRDKAVAQKWLENLRLEPTARCTPYTTFVCRNHFEDYAVGKKLLKRNAVPTINLGFDDVPNAMEKKINRCCCIEDCQPDGNSILFAFPKTEVAFNTWALACNLKMPFPVHKKLFICERHFEKKYISKKRLLDGAFPKLKLNVNSFSSSSNSGSSELILQPVQRTYIRPNLDEDLTLEEFERFSILEENRQRFDIRGSDNLVYDQEHFAQVARSFQSNANKQDKEIMELKQEVEILKKQYLDLEKRILRHQFENKGSNCENDDDINLDWNLTEEEPTTENLEPLEQLAVDEIYIPDEQFAEIEGKAAEIQLALTYNRCVSDYAEWIMFQRRDGAWNVDGNVLWSLA